jgi:hypothetical protein
MRVRAALASATAALVAVGLIACGQIRTMRMTYIKKDSSEARMMEDQETLKRTKGVENVIAHIDADNTINLQLFVDEDDSAIGRKKVLELGYQQIRN